MLRLLPLLAALVLCAGALAGCTEPGGDGTGTVTTGATSAAAGAGAGATSGVPGGLAPTASATQSGAPTTGPPVTGPVLPPATWTDGVLHLHLPVDVVLAGFPSGTAGLLQARLPEATTSSDTLEAHASTAGTLGGGYAYADVPARTTIHVRVVEAPAAAVEAYQAAAGRDADAGERDANAAEPAALALARASGVPSTPERPALVLVHSGKSTGYRYDYPNGGWLTQLRAFGGAEPVLVLDVSAPVDPFVGDAERYDKPLAVDDLKGLEAAVRDAVDLRLGQGPIYVPTAKPCHAITLLYGVRTVGTLPGNSPIAPEDALDAERVRQAFADLTGDPVTVDLKTLQLPADDAVLDALLREVTVQGQSPAGTPNDPVETMRWWVDQNWATYVTPHAGCEEYLSFVGFGDWADQATFGVALDAVGEHRFSFSTFSAAQREVRESGAVGGILYGSLDDSYGRFDLGTFLATHETGHLFGLAHPHNVIDADDGRSVWGFSGTYTAMSYEPFDRLSAFGHLDRANWARNRLPYLFQELDAAGKADSGPAQAALALASTQQWRAAYLAGVEALK